MGWSQQTHPRWLPPRLPTFNPEVPLLTLLATPMRPILMLLDTPGLWSVMLTGLLCLLTLLRFTRPRLPMRLLEVPSTLSEPMLLTTLTTMLDWWDTPMELLCQWSPLMSRLPELSILPPTPVLKRTN